MNELVIHNGREPFSTINYEILVPSQALAEYSKTLGTSFTFSQKAAKAIHQDDVQAFQYDATVAENHRLYYSVSAASGLLTGLVSSLCLDKLIGVNDVAQENLKKTIIRIAGILGCKIKADASTQDSFNDALNFIKSKVRATPAEANQAFNNYATKPSLVGLLFSFLSVFTGNKYGADASGNFCTRKWENPELANLTTVASKALYAFFLWSTSTMAKIANDTNGTIAHGIPHAIYDLIKNISGMPVFKDVLRSYSHSVMPLALTLTKLVAHSFPDYDWQKQLKKQCFPVILNECIVRASYAIIKLSHELKQRKVVDAAGIENISPDVIAPTSNRLLLRMLTISTGTFVVTSTAANTVVSAAKSTNAAEFAHQFIINMNFCGLARFVIAIKEDWHFILEDFENLINQLKAQMSIYELELSKLFSAFHSLELTPEQAQLSYSLQAHRTLLDIENTVIEDNRIKKRAWFLIWKESVNKTLNSANWFVATDDELYRRINASKNSKNAAWLHLVAIDLADFKPYQPFSKDGALKYKLIGERNQREYLKTVFFRRQATVNERQLDRIVSIRKQYEAALDGAVLKATIGVAAVAVVAVATAGVAAAFAPEIAVALAGNSVAGLSGAALTNASLAAIGGGSLAAGGLGMAGGTAIITGGGAVLGVICSGSASAAAIGFLSSKNALIHECAKLLAYCKTVQIEYYHNPAAVRTIKEALERDIVEMEESIDELLDDEASAVTKEQKEKVKTVKSSKDNLKYIRKTIAELRKMLNNEPIIPDEPEDDVPAPEPVKTNATPGFFDNCDTIEAVNAQYHKLATMYHPDHNPNFGDNSMMQIINAQKEERIRVLKSQGVS